MLLPFLQRDGPAAEALAERIVRDCGHKTSHAADGTCTCYKRE